MKFLLILTFAGVLLTACSKDKTMDTEKPVTTTGTVKLSGAFTPTGGITVSGVAKVLSNGSSFSLLLDSFQVSTGPDLKVYLSKEATPVDFINLGPLKSFSGNQSYAIPSSINFAVYKYALIHCQQYNHLFAIAALNP